ncbi:MAG: SpoIIE family protein phosphatase [Phycisphaerae bacterium]|nr:SpoIIE family protein phosphatase [Phycisphaerae bacterium]
MDTKKSEIDADRLGPLVVDPHHARRPDDNGDRAAADAPPQATPRAQALAHRLKQRESEFATLLRITQRVNQGTTLEEVLDFTYDELRAIIPYNRIGLALIDEPRGMVVARWVRSDRKPELTVGYEAPLEGSTLQEIIKTGKPRIINDLEAYLRRNPQSEQTALIVKEGMRSSLTCPLVVQGSRVGFLFFTSVSPGMYCDAHVAFFLQIAGLLSSSIENGRLYSELAEQKGIIEQRNREMTRDLEMARQVQRNLIPKASVRIEGLDIAFEYQPTMQVGGDVLDVIELDRDRVLFFIGDAMGHGVQAALIMAVAKTALQAAVQSSPKPAAILGAINQVIAKICDDTFVTAAACLVDRATERLEFALAGQAWPCWYRAQTRDVAKPGEIGLPLGVDRNAWYDRIEIDFRPGDALVFCTDGVFEAADRAKNRFGYARLREQVQHNAHLPPDQLVVAIKRDVGSHCQGRPLDDDFTILAIKATPRNDQTSSLSRTNG